MTYVLVTHLVFLNDVMGRAKLGRASLLSSYFSFFKRLIFWGYVRTVNKRRNSPCS